MKKIILATVAFSMIATPAAFAQYHGGPQKHSQQHWKGPQGPSVKHHGPQRRYDAPRRWSKGQRLDRDHRRHVIHSRDYRRYRLYEPPRGHQWVRVGDDYALVAVTSGIIGAIIGAAAAR